MPALTPSRRLVGLAAGAAMLLSALGLAGCGSSSTPSATGFSTSDQAQVESMMATALKGRSLSIGATYAFLSPTSSRTIDFAQSPPASRVSFGGSSFAIYTGSTFYDCQKAKCKVLRGKANPRQQLADAYNGQTFIATMRSVLLSPAQRAAYGISVRFSGATYAGHASKCVTLTITKQKRGTLVLCEMSNGLLDYEASGTTSETLTSTTNAPPATDFVLPKGDTVTP